MKKFLVACGVIAMTASLSSCCGDSCSTDSANQGFNDSVSYYFGKINGATLAKQIAADPMSDKIDKKEFIKGLKYTVLADTANHGLNYGVQVGNYFNRAMMQFADGVDFNREVFVKEFEKALMADSISDMDQIGHTLDSLMNIVQERAQAKRLFEKENNPVAVQNKLTGKAFMDKIKTEDGVKTTESGLAYKVVKEGTGARPEVTDRVSVKYKGTFIDDKVFDESSEEAVEFPVTGVIPGFSEGLQLMTKGSKYILYIPGELGYGVNAPESIGPNQTLIFEVELVDIKK